MSKAPALLAAAVALMTPATALATQFDPPESLPPFGCTTFTPSPGTF